MNVNNVCMFRGNLTRDPELRDAGNSKVCKFGMAVNGRKKNKSTGDWEDDPLFIDCEAWGKQAEIIAEHCQKGKQLAVRCTARLEQWEDKTSGQKRSKVSFRVEDFDFVGGNGGGNANNGGEAAEAPAAPTKKTRAKKVAETVPPDDDVLPPAEEDGIPF